jgi:LPS-assembly lipoprotein
MNKLRVLLLAAMLQACQYHLRGEADVPEVLQHVYMQSASPSLKTSFKEMLHQVGGEVVDKPEAKGLIVNILSERFDRRSLSLSDTGKTNEFQLFYVLEFEVFGADNKVIIPRQRIPVTRDYFNNQQDIIGKNNEEALIRDEMYRQAVRSMMDRSMALLRQAPPSK